jgi:hypothetical protein
MKPGSLKVSGFSHVEMPSSGCEHLRLIEARHYHALDRDLTTSHLGFSAVDAERAFEIGGLRRLANPVI